MKTRNDILVEYVRSRYPEIEKTFDFAAYSAGVALKEFGRCIKAVSYTHLSDTPAVTVYVPNTYTKRHCGRNKRKSFVRNIGDSVSYTSNAPRECEKHLNIEDDNLHRKDKNLSFRY